MSNAAPRTARLRSDRPWVGVTAILLVLIVMLSSMTFSYAAIGATAEWSGAFEGLQWIAPLFIDGAILTYTVSLTVNEWRRAKPRIIRRTRRTLRAFTGLSVVLNAAHAGAHWDWDFTRYEAWFGALIAISAPIAALLSAEEVVQLAFSHPDDEAPTAQVPAAEEVIAVETPTAPLPYALEQEPHRAEAAAPEPDGWADFDYLHEPAPPEYPAVVGGGTDTYRPM